MRELIQKSLLLLTLLSALLVPAWAQKNGRSVTGTVVEASSGEPLIGAYVSLVEGRNVGALTDLDGRFTIVLPPSTDNKAILKVESVGYEETEITVGALLASGTIAVKVKSELLDEVLVVGYGTQKKVSSVGSITQTKGEDLLRVGNMNTVSEAIQGQMPGVITYNTTGQPGDNAATIYIRGKSTWQDTSPLILVDGIERDMNDVDFNEIESISVLKDASATAVYGVRGGNGVILLTTKRGNSERPTVKFTTSWGFKSPTAVNEWADHVTALKIWNEAYAHDDNWTMLRPQSTIDAWEYAYAKGLTGPYSEQFPSVDWNDSLLETAISENYNVNVNGKTEFLKYFASIGYQHDGSIFDIPKAETFDPRIYFNRLNWRANFDFNLTKTTVFTINIAGKMGYRNTQFYTDIYQWITRAEEHSFPVKWESGIWGDGSTVGSNPMADFYNGGQLMHKSFQGWYDAKINQDLSFITEGLSAHASISYDQATTTLNTVQLGGTIAGTTALQQNSFPSEHREYDYSSVSWDEAGNPVYPYSAASFGSSRYVAPAASTFDSIRRIANKLYYELGINYNRKFGDHEVGLMGVFNRTKTTSASSGTLDFPAFREDWVARGTYNWKERYLFEGNISYTGSEKFAPGKRFGLFPSWSIGWRVTEEPWMKWATPVLSNMKLRYSNGKVGTDAGAKRFQYIQLFTQDEAHNWGYSVNKDFGPMYLEGAIANADATWETSVKQNLGVELGFFKKLSVNLDLFEEFRDHILLTPRTTASWVGASLTAANLGSTKNHGLELEVEWQDKIGREFHYHVKGAFSTSESRMISRDDPADYETYKKYAGKPVGFQNRYYVTGNFLTVDDMFNAAQPQGSGTAHMTIGDLAYLDYNADGVVDTNDYIPSEYLNYPLTTYSLKLGFDWKGLSVSALIYAPVGLHKLYPSYYLYDFPYGNLKAQPNTLDRWTMATGSETEIIRPTAHGDMTYNKKTSTLEYIDYSYVRLKSVDISYSLPKSWLKAMHMASASVFATGNNLLTLWKGDHRIDPETAESNGDTSDSNNVYPIVKSYNLGLRFSF